MHAPGFSVDWVVGPGTVRLIASGELDLAVRDRFVEAAANAVERGDQGTVLEIDLRGVTFTDSTGLTALVQCCRMTPGVRVVLLNPGPAVLGPLERTGLDALFLVRHEHIGAS